jgi:hypothetical protein
MNIGTMAISEMVKLGVLLLLLLLLLLLCNYHGRKTLESLLLFVCSGVPDVSAKKS